MRTGNYFRVRISGFLVKNLGRTLDLCSIRTRVSRGDLFVRVELRTWDVFVETSDVSSSGTEVEVTLTICCENESPSRIILPRVCLHSGQIYKTTIELEERHGTVQKVRLQREDIKNGDDWHCREVLYAA
ncbi:hypothetical protein NDU88_001198 [Pleurodeles waltl]|uniref:PLAT domain-containing protein n=1 Tax=Pleurodeles waltl TaxID=8319 RepID=A0AAV7US41_PLEWA|nr:hypothetical protein NDU88_001198 [Pleurodeles waltl]